MANIDLKAGCQLITIPDPLSEFAPETARVPEATLRCPRSFYDFARTELVARQKVARFTPRDNEPSANSQSDGLVGHIPVLAFLAESSGQRSAFSQHSACASSLPCQPFEKGPFERKREATLLPT